MKLLMLASVASSKSPVSTHIWGSPANVEDHHVYYVDCGSCQHWIFGASCELLASGAMNYRLTAFATVFGAEPSLMILPRL